MRIVLIDFGITKDLEAALGSTTQNFPTSAIMATLPYAAPEVLTRQRGVAAAQDMFAVGVMALEVHPRLVKGCDGAILSVWRKTPRDTRTHGATPWQVAMGGRWSWRTDKERMCREVAPRSSAAVRAQSEALTLADAQIRSAAPGAEASLRVRNHKEPGLCRSLPNPKP